MYEIELRRNAHKALDKIQEAERTKIVPALLGLEKDPRPKGVEKIRGTELWRIRAGNYRIVYHIDDEANKVIVVRVGHRRDVYRGL
ncbi:MAG: type II toxin-antitoxin system RelE/ParE family toxin [Chloroflexota bacterium]